MKIPLIGKRAANRNIARRTSLPAKPKSVYNYSSSRNESSRPYQRGHDQAARPSSIWTHKYFKYAVLVLVLPCLFFLLGLRPSAQIKLDGQPVIARPDNAYQDSINQHLGDSLASYSKLTFDNDKLTRQITADFPEISVVKVAIPLFGRQPKVELSFAQAVAKLKVFDDDTYILDKQGRALARESEAAGSLNQEELITVNDTSDQPVELGKVILTAQQLDFIDQTIKQAANKKLSVQSISLAGGASQLNVQYAGESYQVKYSFLADPRLSSGAYFAIRQRLADDNKKPKQYIDLRVPNRAYVK